ncbi:hypothetical protein DL98DRAFT_460610 [Cadophora sp. DSE1049]|nr:hypothetical protein DL98DRAFT_460610 [Cadophora sp. DSE1049]
MRKVKCDEAVPGCSPCSKRKVPCSGYASKLVWVTEDQKTYAPNGRRFLDCASTWITAAVMGSGELEYYVSLCDAALYVEGFTVEWSSRSDVPFGAFPSQQNHLQALAAPTTLSKSMIYGSPLSDDEALLFDHYVHHVAVIMMPYEDDRNPWTSAYPAVALYHMSQNNKSLFDALLAQAAYNLAHLGHGNQIMLDQALKAYTSSIGFLRSLLSDHRSDYGSLIASIMTLMFVEIYSGSSNSWRSHFDAAWSVLQDHEASQSWTATTFTEASTQSLCIVKIISDTSRPRFAYTREEEDRRDRLIRSVSFSESFGFTIGANGLLMACIDGIRRVSRDLMFGEAIDMEFEANEILSRLNHCREITAKDSKITPDPTTESAEHTMASCHLNAFIHAAYIYLYRTLLNYSPRSVQHHVSAVFANIRTFFSIGEGNLTLWPAFIAAVECYEEPDMSAARSWLTTASKVGMGNRQRIKVAVEEVWRRRECTALEFGLDVGDTVVDWQCVMADLNFDILLV